MNEPPPPGLILLSASTIVDSLYPHLSVADILNISKVCHATYFAVKAWLPSAYNINRHLEPFLGDLATTLQFRSIQAATGTIISGSQALQFFDRVRYPGSDLDIYTPCRHTLLVGMFFLSIGYQFQPSGAPLTTEYGDECRRRLEEVSSRRQTVHRYRVNAGRLYECSFVEEVFNFTKGEVEGGNQLKVQVIAVDPEYPPLACVLNFHFSLVVNFITHDRAYSMFPRTTFLDRVGVTLRRDGNQRALGRAYTKYIGRDFKFSAAPHHPTNPLSPLSPGHRWVGDHQTWTIALNMTDVVVPDWLAHACESFGRPLMTGNGFTLRNSPEKEEDKQHQYGHPEDMGDIPLVFSILQSPLLRLPSILPFHLQLDYPNSIEFLDSQEAVIFERYSVTVQTVQPELTPGWKYRDVELLQLAQDDFEKWNTNAT